MYATLCCTDPIANLLQGWLDARVPLARSMSESTSPQSNISPSFRLHTGSPVPSGPVPSSPGPSSPVIHSFDITDREFQPTSPSRFVRGSPASQQNIYIMAPPPLPITAHTTSQGMQTDTVQSQHPPEFNNSKMITDQGVQTDTMQPYNPPEFNTETTTNGIDTHTTEMGYDNKHQGMADQQMADQEMADQEMADLGMELQDLEMEDQEGRHLCAVDLDFITEYETIEQESPLQPEYLELAHTLLNLGLNKVQQLLKASITDPPVLSNDACIVPLNIQRNFNHFHQSQRCPYEEISSR